MSEDEYRYREPYYPRRARYGDPTQRCAWCGRPTDFGARVCIGGALNRHYCSFSCRAAGDYGINKVFSLVCAIATVFIPLMLYGYLQPFPVDPGPFLSLVILFTLLLSVPVWMCCALGRSERQQELVRKHPHTDR